jgi:hypothetical protein
MLATAITAWSFDLPVSAAPSAGGRPVDVSGQYYCTAL